MAPTRNPSSCTGDRAEETTEYKRCEALAYQVDWLAHRLRLVEHSADEVSVVLRTCRPEHCANLFSKVDSQSIKRRRT